MADDITKPILLSNGWILSRSVRAYNSNLDIHWIPNPYGGGNGFVFNLFPQFRIQAAGLLPSQSYEVSLYEYEVLKYGESSISYPNEWTNLIESPINQSGYKASVNSNAQGDVDEIITFPIPAFQNKSLIVRNDVLYKSFGDPITSYSWGENAQPHNPDPNKLMEIETDKFGGVTQIDAGGSIGVRHVVTIDRKVRYNLKLEGVGFPAVYTDIEVLYALATAVDTEDSVYPSSADVDILTIPIIIGELNPLYSPAAIGSSVDRAVIPYNKTTEREVIHLDNRLKSTE